MQLLWLTLSPSLFLYKARSQYREFNDIVSVYTLNTILYYSHRADTFFSPCNESLYSRLKCLWCTRLCYSIFFKPKMHVLLTAGLWVRFKIILLCISVLFSFSCFLFRNEMIIVACTYMVCAGQKLISFLNRFVIVLHLIAGTRAQVMAAAIQSLAKTVNSLKLIENQFYLFIFIHV